jgi:hypothetical protein
VWPIHFNLFFGKISVEEEISQSGCRGKVVMKKKDFFCFANMGLGVSYKDHLLNE